MAFLRQHAVEQNEAHDAADVHQQNAQHEPRNHQRHDQSGE
jgi:hypothetical protein